MRICLVSHRLGGFDGVSIEAAKWCSGFRSLGWQVTRTAGIFLDHQPGDVVLQGMWADHPGGQPPPVDHSTIKQLCREHDLIVLDNAGSLWSAPEASLAWQQHTLEMEIPVIIRHHDPPWQVVPLRDPVKDDRGDNIVPLHHPQQLHVVISRYTYAEFSDRWPALIERSLHLVHNRIDVAALTNGDRDRTRLALGVEPEELLIVHPARIESANKNIPRAIEFVRALAGLISPPVRYWLTDDGPASTNVVRCALEHAPGLLRGHVAEQADLYAAADLVLLPSIWEGWGLPVTEAAAAGKLIVAGPYPVLDEIRAAGLTVFDPGELAPIAKLLTDPALAETILLSNRQAVLKHLDIQPLPYLLSKLAAQATQLTRSQVA